MKNTVIEDALEILDKYICKDGLFEGEKIQNSWAKIKQYVTTKAAISNFPKNNYEYIMNLSPEELAVFLAIDSGKRSADPEDWLREIKPTYDWLNEKPVFELNEFAEDSDKYCKLNLGSKYEGVVSGDYKEAKDISKEGEYL